MLYLFSAATRIFKSGILESIISLARKQNVPNTTKTKFIVNSGERYVLIYFFFLFAVLTALFINIYCFCMLIPLISATVSHFLILLKTHVHAFFLQQRLLVFPDSESWSYPVIK